MVIFELTYQTDLILKYEYYPEGNRSKAPGIIIVDRVNDSVEVEKSAEQDFLAFASADDLKSMRDSINATRVEQGEEPLTEDELPTATKSSSWYTYASHAMQRILESYEKGIILPKGLSAW